MGKVYSRFQTKTAQKPLPHGAAHTNLDPRALFPTSKAREKRPGDEVRNIPIYIHSFIHSFILFFFFAINQKYNNSIQKYIKIIYNIPTKLFTRLNVVKARKPI